MTVTVAGVRSTSQLLDFIAGGGQPKYLFFWGHQPPAPDRASGELGQPDRIDSEHGERGRQRRARPDVSAETLAA